MSLIRKPDVEVFRDSGAVTALRGARELVQEGGSGALRTVGNLWLTMMVIMFMMSGVGALVMAETPLMQLVAAVLIGLSLWALYFLWRAPTREIQFVEGQAGPSNVSVALPEHLRGAADREAFHVRYWPKAFVNKATLLFIVGFVFLAIGGYNAMTVIGLLFVMRAVLLLSIFFGGANCVSATADRLTVHSLLGNASIYWSDITVVTVRKFPAWAHWIKLSTGAREHIVVSGLDRLGTGRLLIPYKLLGLDQNGVNRLVHRILSRAEAARAAGAAGPAAAAPAGFGQRNAAPAPAGDGLSEPGFDPDAIIARYMREREATQRAQAQAPELPPVQRPAGFGRKGLPTIRA